MGNNPRRRKKRKQAQLDKKENKKRRRGFQPIIPTTSISPSIEIKTTIKLYKKCKNCELEIVPIDSENEICTNCQDHLEEMGIC